MPTNFSEKIFSRKKKCLFQATMFFKKILFSRKFVNDGKKQNFLLASLAWSQCGWPHYTDTREKYFSCPLKRRTRGLIFQIWDITFTSLKVSNCDYHFHIRTCYLLVNPLNLSYLKEKVSFTCTLNNLLCDWKRAIFQESG